MRISLAQLKKSVSGGLSSVYLVAGDEPLLIKESTDYIRKKAREEGYTEREVMDVDATFKWDGLIHAASGMSLFAEKKILELRIPKSKPGRDGAKILAEYLAKPPEDTMLMVICGKLDSASLKSKWVSLLEKAGVFVHVKAIDKNQLPAWIQTRCQYHQLTLTADAIQLMVDRCEGNLLAVVNEIEKLLLFNPEGEIGADLLIELMSDSARFNVYELVDTALDGDVKKVARILAGLRGEGVAPPLIAWAITREVRVMVKISEAMQQGKNLAAAVAQQGVWSNRKSRVSNAVRKNAAKQWKQCLLKCASLDKLIKGRRRFGNVWNELLTICLQIAGVEVFQHNIGEVA